MSKLDTVKNTWSNFSTLKKVMVVFGSLIFVSAVTSDGNKQNTSQSSISSEQLAAEKEIQNAQEEKKLEVARIAETKRIEDEKKAEEARRADEASKAEQARLAEEARKAEEIRVAEAARASNCNPNYSGCVPNASDVDCYGGRGNGPAYTGATTVIGYDVYDLDRDGDGYACE